MSILASQLSQRQILVLSGAVLLLGIIDLMLPLCVGFAVVALFFAGLGIGTLFPGMLRLTPINSGKTLASSILSQAVPVS